MFNRSQEAARRRRQMEAKDARVDAVRGHHPRRDAADGDRGDSASEVPPPKHGGTFYFCIEPMFSIRRKGGVENVECHEVENTPNHFRTASKYRRHWRLFHA